LFETTERAQRQLSLVQGDDTLIEEARRDAEEQNLDAAQENGILNQAESNAEDSVRAFMNSLGYEKFLSTLGKQWGVPKPPSALNLRFR
jgi:hypothetical protein